MVNGWMTWAYPVEPRCGLFLSDQDLPREFGFWYSACLRPAHAYMEEMKKPS